MCRPSCVHRQQEALIRQLLGQPPVRVAQAHVHVVGLRVIRLSDLTWTRLCFLEYRVTATGTGSTGNSSDMTKVRSWGRWRWCCWPHRLTRKVFVVVVVVVAALPCHHDTVASCCICPMLAFTCTVEAVQLARIESAPLNSSPLAV